ncbi:RbsD/FucU family protein [Parasphaerochaeta coccoides]|uniref:RbsD or FucU transport n=1 Tax=Parasphaerochaeta coccoides (strain ATCC BAA-1237 / DSM 17374 / SPN1) TaxID=760011 RepID=F4GKH9_PARC1|nr:RbsD/FucU domain-containing protein [Parasphaerochaeta coccoides]AEC02862.1 RbsD or FucU transport [Parasphaerochaeta coccoides DSM 17374]
MLKGISSILSPELLKILMEMGHGDELVIGDGNFPAAAYARRLVRLDGHGVPQILEAILQLYPLDKYADNVIMMEVPATDPVETPIWETYRKIALEDPHFKGFVFEERFAFYERAKKAYAIIATGESAIYANIIIKKGVV